MADNVLVSAGSGTTVAADEVVDATLGTVKVQFVKVMDGTLDSTTKLKIAAEDAAHGSGDGGIMLLAVRKDTAAALAGTDGDYIPLIVDANGALHVNVGTPALPSGAATAAAQATESTLTGAVTETAPATDTASSGLNGRLQRIAQRITSLIALIPAALTGSGNFKVAVQEALPAGTATIGATLDAGPAQTLTRTFTTSADMTTAAAITPAPAGGQRVYAVDILVSVGAAMNVLIQMETSANVLARLDFAGAGATQVTLRGILMGDADAKKLMGKTSAAGQVSFTAITFSAVAS